MVFEQIDSPWQNVFHQPLFRLPLIDIFLNLYHYSERPDRPGTHVSILNRDAVTK